MDGGVTINRPPRDGRMAFVKSPDGISVELLQAGPALPAELRPRVFERFFRGDLAHNSATEGSGLGLSIARDVARSHGGDVALAASPLGGLRVVVRIPL